MQSQVAINNFDHAVLIQIWQSNAEVSESSMLVLTLLLKYFHMEGGWRTSKNGDIFDLKNNKDRSDPKVYGQTLDFAIWHV